VILAILLAFGIEMLPPGSVLMSHHHAGGAAAHVHAGRILGAAPGAAARVADQAAYAGDAGLQRAAARDLHQHVAQPLVCMQGPAGLPSGPALLVTALPGAVAPAEIPARRRAGQARAPPFLTA
jgi:hypothetical protein